LWRVCWLISLLTQLNSTLLLNRLEAQARTKKKENKGQKHNKKHKYTS